ncbi:prolyl oligopeptidase family serine peptidase [Galbibacter mesophilus]|uniref:prolyl oligopeptidase family serine peptidase n=1 Tax=Galbibacter mesophilus TaxID=379069 RepID=UPI00191EA90F|nr:prolyl oligopeptidase family serine peptidase [Galbibacter mesophilus]MCM5664308.1 prolyl oligopeptidase family serine peptidase [Galbibacter mesophilus]
MVRNFLLTAFWLLFVIVATAQKKSISVADFDTWKQIENKQLSENGKFLVYEYNPGMGDGTLVITNLSNGNTDSIPRGYGAKINGNSSFVAFKIKAPIEVRRKEDTKKTKKNKKSKDTLAIFVLNSRKTLKYANNYGFKLPEEGGNWLAYKTVVKKEKDSLLKEKDSLKQDKKKKKTENDTLLVAFNPISLDSLVFKNTADYTWAKSANQLLITSEEKDSIKTTSQLVKFNAEAKKTDTVFTSEGIFKKTVLDNSGSKWAFLRSKDTSDVKNYELFTGSNSNTKALSKEKIDGLPKGWLPSENQDVYFSEDSKRLYFGTAEANIEHPKDTLLNAERAKLDVWSWTDKELQPMQKVNLKKDQNKTYLAVYDFSKNSAVQLADTLVPSVRVYKEGDAKFAIGSSNEAYKRAASWSALFLDDYYLINTETGEKSKLVDGQNNVWLGPAQKYAVYYNRLDSIYYSINLSNKQKIALTTSVEVPFYDERNDTPSEPRPYGIAGWTENDDEVFIYDRYDIWQIDPSGSKAPENVTSNGRDTKTVYRYLQLDEEEEFILPKKTLVSVFNEETKKAGFAFANLLNKRALKSIVLDDFQYGNPMKAKNAETLVFTKESYTVYPDLWQTDIAFKNPEQVTQGQKQLNQYKWGKVSLESWTNYDGVKLQGLLYIPEDLDPNKKYPLVSYFYELKSDSYHQFYHPTPSRSTINKIFYPSNDYVVFIPDIIYKEGYPGESAYNCIVSGIEAMEAKYSFIDSNNLALQGQSWGGYQTAYIITKTDKFAAAMAGAPVSNMTSAYGGIRWGSGMSRMFQYEHTQSRIGGTLWDKLDLYMENSPLFKVPEITTPLLMMHNDDDGAVPWYQGIEFFVALRRLNKPVWMLSYNNEPHNLKGESWGNRKDLSIRMMQFFDHYLKDKPAPEWMKKGRPAVEKEFNKGY